VNYSEDDGRAVDILSHDLRVRFDPDRMVLHGEDSLLLDVLQASSSLRFRLDDALRVLSVTSAEGGSHIFFRVRGQDSVVVSLGPYTGRVGQMRLLVRYAGALDPAPVEDESMQASLADPNRGQSDEEIFVERVLLYTNKNAWYPRNLTDDHARYRARFDVPAGFNAVAGGRLVDDRREGDRRLLEYHLEQPGKYVSVIVGRLGEAGAPLPGSPPLRAFSVRRQRHEAIRSLPEARAIVDFFQELFGPCPYDPLNLVFTENLTPGGHSPPGLVLLQARPALATRNLRDDPANFTDVPGFFLAHEIAHQWWGQGVGPQNYRERWLSEGAAQYAAALWIRKSRGEETFLAVLKRLGDWALRHASAGPLSLGYRVGHIRNDPQAYRAVIYDKGAYVFHMLRLLVGDEAFSRALSTFQEKHRYQKAGTEDLREALEQAGGRPLGPYFQEWVEGVLVPELRLAYDTAAAGLAFRTTVRVSATGLPGPVPVAVTLAGEAEGRRVTLEKAGGEFTFETALRPARVEINADRSLLARVRGPD
jgi:aminopeptidase N